MSICLGEIVELKGYVFGGGSGGCRDRSPDGNLNPRVRPCSSAPERFSAQFVAVQRAVGERGLRKSIIGRESEPLHAPMFICPFFDPAHALPRRRAPWRGSDLLCESSKTKGTAMQCLFVFGDPDGNRTRVTAVKGRCLSRLTTGPLLTLSS